MDLIRTVDGRVVVIVNGDVAGALARLLRSRFDVEIRDGARIPRRFVDLEDALRRLAALETLGSASGSVLGGGVDTAPNWVTVKQAARDMGRSPRWVRVMAQRGDLPGATRIGRDWLIPAAAVHERKA